MQAKSQIISVEFYCN